MRAFIRDLSVFTKIFLVVTATGLFFNLVLFAVFLPIINTKYIEAERHTPQAAVEGILTLVAEQYDRFKSGQITEDEAKANAINIVKKYRYLGNEYIWINDLSPKMVAHPIKPEMDGVDLSNNKDPKGKYLFVEFVKMAKASGGGFVDYYWPMPGSATPVAKTSYVKLFEPWGWVLGSGVYLDKVKKAMVSLLYLCAGLAAAVGIFAAAACWFVAGAIRGSLAGVVDALSRVEGGDLTVTVVCNSNDEVGKVARSLGNVVAKTAGLIGKISHSASRVVSASGTLNLSCDDIRGGAQVASEQTMAVAAASEEMAATSVEIAKNCLLAAETAHHAEEVASHGAQIVQESLVGMERIAGCVERAAVAVSALGDRSDQIGAIVATIEDIADQTNLLALNAAIEAARAGDQGRGFAVVADEVRALAERTSAATKEIGEMIKAIQHETSGAVAGMRNGVGEVNSGMERSRQSGEALHKILGSINDVTTQIQQIATAAEEQTATTSDIAGNIQQVSLVLQKNLEGVGEVEKLISGLRRDAEATLADVGSFRV